MLFEATCLHCSMYTCLELPRAGNLPIAPEQRLWRKSFNRGDIHPDAPGSSALEAPRLELAHVLFMDLVSFSTMPMEEQRQSLHNLQEIVRQTPQLRDGERDSGLIRLPTGDGMALVFFGDPIACVQCALDVSARLKDSPLKLRMGVNTGPVYRVADINTNLNAAGGGINTAQRIMDAGDAGHILVSKSTADILLQFKEWAGRLHDLGEHPVKHGVTLRFYNLCTTVRGNPALPSRFRAEHVLSANRRKRRIMAAVAGVVIVIIGLAVARQSFVSKRRRSVAVMGFRNITGRHEADWVHQPMSRKGSEPNSPAPESSAPSPAKSRLRCGKIWASGNSTA